MLRAAHQLFDQPKVLDDPLAVRIVGAAGERKLRENEVAAPYVIPLTDKNTPVQREHVREFVRANGPTIGQTADALSKAFNRADIFEN